MDVRQHFAHLLHEEGKRSTGNRNFPELVLRKQNDPLNDVLVNMCSFLRAFYLFQCEIHRNLFGLDRRIVDICIWEADDLLLQIEFGALNDLQALPCPLLRNIGVLSLQKVSVELLLLFLCTVSKHVNILK